MYIFVRRVDFLLHNWGLGVVAILGLWNHAYYMHKNESTNVNVTVPNWHILSPRALFPPLGKLCTTSSDSVLFWSMLFPYGDSNSEGQISLWHISSCQPDIPMICSLNIALCCTGCTVGTVLGRINGYGLVTMHNCFCDVLAKVVVIAVATN